MTPRNLFNVILKIFGLFFLREIINASFQLISSLVYIFRSDAEGSVVSIAFSLAVVGLYVFIGSQLLFKTNKWIDMLRLDQGFTDEGLLFDSPTELAINLSSHLVLTVALVALGGFILVEEIPEFCRQFYIYFQGRNTQYNGAGPELSYMIVLSAKIIIGLLILGERKRIITFIEDRRNAVVEEAE